MTDTEQALQTEKELTEIQVVVAALARYLEALDRIMQTPEGAKIALEATEIVGHILGGLIKVADSLPGLDIALKAADRATKVEVVLRKIAPNLPPDSVGYRHLLRLLTAIKEPAPDVSRSAKLGIRIAKKAPVVGRVVDAAGDSVFTAIQIGTDVSQLVACTRELSRMYGADLQGPSAEVAAAVKAFLPDSDDFARTGREIQQAAETVRRTVAGKAQEGSEAIRDAASQVHDRLGDVHLGEKARERAQIIDQGAREAGRQVAETFTRLTSGLPFKKQ